MYSIWVESSSNQVSDIKKVIKTLSEEEDKDPAKKQVKKEQPNSKNKLYKIKEKLLPRENKKRIKKEQLLFHQR